MNCIGQSPWNLNLNDRKGNVLNYNRVFESLLVTLKSCDHGDLFIP